MSITHETRRKSLESITSDVKAHRKVILDILGNREMTAHEIADELFRRGIPPYYERNFTAPWFAELSKIGQIAACSKRTNPLSGREITVWKRKRTSRDITCKQKQRFPTLFRINEKQFLIIRIKLSAHANRENSMSCAVPKIICIYNRNTMPVSKTLKAAQQIIRHIDSVVTKN